jgi:hypothetical protein
MIWTFILGISILIIYFESKLGLMCKNKMLLAVPIIIWMIHTIFFIITSLFFAQNMSEVFINNWLQSLQLHGYLTILSLSIYKYIKYRGRA